MCTSFPVDESACGTECVPPAVEQSTDSRSYGTVYAAELVGGLVFNGIGVYLGERYGSPLPAIGTLAATATYAAGRLASGFLDRSNQISSTDSDATLP